MAQTPKAAKPKTPKPKAPGKPATRARVRMYRHGLGDCLLVELPRKKQPPFRIMVDCGLVLGAKDADSEMQKVMQHLCDHVSAAQPAGQAIDLLVVTHAHWDHVSGFVQASDEFARLPVRDVWMGWTEDLSDPLAVELKQEFALAERALRQAVAMDDAGVQRFGAAPVIGQVKDLLDFLGEGEGEGEVEGEGDGEAGLAVAKRKDKSTAGAVRAAAAKARQGPGALKFCKPGEPPVEIPGTDARIFILGPPRDKERLRKMDPSRREPETYSLTAMHGLLPLGSAFANWNSGGQASNLPDPDEPNRPFDARWTIPWEAAQDDDQWFKDQYFSESQQWRRIDGEWMRDLTSLALLLDRAVNNSSLVLAIELEPGGDVILLAADAQVGNWMSWLELEWDVAGRKVTGPDLIARTLAYKVGHHASLNATLRQHGVEKMSRLAYSLVPVDAEQAAKRGWGNNIPFPALLEALSAKGKATVLRSDRPWVGDDTSVIADPLFFEISL